MPRTYLQLPIDPDEGFPQGFLLNFSGRTYRIGLYVNVLREALPATEVFDLPLPGAFVVMRVARETGDAPQIIFQRKLVLDLEYEAAELAFVFHKLRIARRNLNGTGAFGSDIIGGVAER